MSEETAAAEADESVDVPENDDAQIDPEIEKKARSQGWAPKEEWRGDPKDWRDAEAFVKRGEEIDARLKPQLRKMERENAELKRDIEEFKSWMPKMEQRAYERARKDIEAKMDNAVAVGDVDTYNAAKAEMAGLEKEVAQATKREPANNSGDAVVAAWKAENDWFDRDPDLQEAATIIHGRLNREQPGLSLEENLEETKKRVQQMYPAKFGIKERKTAPEVEPGRGGPRGGGSGKTYDNLPAEAKAACARQIKNGLVKDRAEYVKYYFEDE